MEVQADRQHQIDRDLFLGRQQEERDNRLFDRQQAMQNAIGVRQSLDERFRAVSSAIENGDIIPGAAATTAAQRIRAQMTNVGRAKNLTQSERDGELLRLYGELVNTLENAGPSLPNERRKPPQERMADSTVTQPVYAINPDGSQGAFMGWRTSTSTRRNGEEQWNHSFEAFKPPTKGGENPLVEETEAFNKFVDSFIGKSKGKNQTTQKDIPYSEDDIWELWQQKKALNDRLRGRKPKQPPVPTGMEGMTPEAQQYFQGVFPNQFGGRRPPAQGGPQHMGIPQIQGPDTPMRQRQFPNAPAPQQAAPPAATKPITAAQLPPEIVAQLPPAARNLPVVGSPEEAEARGPGHYVLPTGQIVEVTP